MSLSYTIKESFSGFKRTRLSTAISIVTISISLLFLGIFTVASFHTARFINLLRSTVELEAFLEEPLSGVEVDQLKDQIAALEGIQVVSHVSKEEAARILSGGIRRKHL